MRSARPRVERELGKPLGEALLELLNGGYCLEDAAERLQVSVSTLRLWLKKEGIRPHLVWGRAK